MKNTTENKRTKKRKRLYALVECAALIALSTVLSMMKIIQMPLGGSVTLLSMLPVTFISIRQGVKWGLPSAFIYSIGQLFLGGALGWGLNAKTLIVCILFDYVIAYTSLGLSGIFSSRGNVGIVSGCIMSLSLRFLCHLISGATIWAKLEPWKIFGLEFTNAPLLYSVCYNGFYMLPEIIFTAIATIILIKIPIIKKHLTNK